MRDLQQHLLKNGPSSVIESLIWSRSKAGHQSLVPVDPSVNDRSFCSSLRADGFASRSEGWHRPVRNPFARPELTACLPWFLTVAKTPVGISAEAPAGRRPRSASIRARLNNCASRSGRHTRVKPLVGELCCNLFIPHMPVSRHNKN